MVPCLTCTTAVLSLCRSRTLLNFVARQVAERYPDGACLKAALPSAAAAASMDLVAAQTELKGLLGEAWCAARLGHHGLRGMSSGQAALPRLHAYRLMGCRLPPCACRALEAALAAGDGCAAQRMLFDETVLSGLATLQAEMSEAEAAFRWASGGSCVANKRHRLCCRQPAIQPWHPCWHCWS